MLMKRKGLGSNRESKTEMGGRTSKTARVSTSRPHPTPLDGGNSSFDRFLVGGTGNNPHGRGITFSMRFNPRCTVLAMRRCGSPILPGARGTNRRRVALDVHLDGENPRAEPGAS